MSVNAFSGVKFDRPLVEPGVYQQPQHVALETPPQKHSDKLQESPYDTIEIVGRDIAKAPKNPNFDTIEIVKPEKPKKRKGFMEGISSIAKFFVSLGEMTKASIKAAWYGGLTMLGGLAGFWAFGALPQTYKSVEGSLTKIFTESFKNISKKGKIISGVAAAGVATYHIVKGILTTNQRTANVDHALKTGHRDV